MFALFAASHAVSGSDSLTWSSTIGSDKRDAPFAMTIDNADASVIVVGYTKGDLSMLSAQESTYPTGAADAFLRKQSAETGKDEWALQVGTTDVDRQGRFTGVAVNAAGGVVVAGYAYGSVYANSLGAYDILLAEYDASSKELKWGLQCCTAGVDFAEGVAVHEDTSVVVVGESSTEHRLPNQASQLGGDFVAFVRSFSAVGGAAWAEAWNFTLHTDEGADGTLLSGRDCYMTSVATDSRGDVIAAGHTTGTLSRLDLEPVGGEDAFVVKLDGSSGAWIWRAQIASGGDDRVTSVIVDENDDVLIAGYTDGGSPFGRQRDYLIGGKDIIVAKLYGNTGSTLWSAQIGSDGDDEAQGVAVSSSQGDYGARVAVTGWTDGHFSGKSSGHHDIFAVLLDASDGSEIARTQLGGDGDDEANAIAADSAVGDFFVAGTTTTAEGGEDVIVLRLSGDKLADSHPWPRPSSKSNDDLPTVWVALIVCVVLAVPLMGVVGYYAGQHFTAQKYERLQREGYNDRWMRRTESDRFDGIVTTQQSLQVQAAIPAAGSPNSKSLGEVDIAGRILPAGTFEMTPVAGGGGGELGAPPPFNRGTPTNDLG